MQKIVMIGSREMSQRLTCFFESTNFGEVVGMFDDFESEGTIKCDKPILGKIADIPAVYKKGAFDSVAIGVGYSHRRFRKEAFEFLKGHQIPSATFIHPTSYIDKAATIKAGCVVLANCTIEMDAELHENVYLGATSFIGQDAKIHAHSYCSAATKLAGGAEVGECCFLGINTTAIDGIRIGMNVQTAAGAVVTKDVVSHVLVAGVPAVVKREISF
ncbi:MAG: hypothetical protein JRI70_10805 [Deltaproteobacteria bacterium]|nr:hypothetical protein [Deltaproteobacteria bacterium]